MNLLGTACESATRYLMLMIPVYLFIVSTIALDRLWCDPNFDANILAYITQLLMGQPIFIVGLVSFFIEGPFTGISSTGASHLQFGSFLLRNKAKNAAPSTLTIMVLILGLMFAGLPS